jgi:hypothetical protein
MDRGTFFTGTRRVSDAVSPPTQSGGAAGEGPTAKTPALFVPFYRQPGYAYVRDAHKQHYGHWVNAGKGYSFPNGKYGCGVPGCDQANMQAGHDTPASAKSCEDRFLKGTVQTVQQGRKSRRTAQLLCTDLLRLGRGPKYAKVSARVAQGGQDSKGRDGRDGRDGRGGAMGPRGPPWNDGRDGAMGPRGPPGNDGRDGAMGHGASRP